MNTRFAARSLGVSLALWVGALVLLATILVSLAGYISARLVLERQINERLAATAKQTIGSVDEYMGARVEELRAMVFGQLQIPNLTPQQRNITLYNYINAFGSARYTDLSIVDLNGKLAATTGSPVFELGNAKIEQIIHASKPGLLDGVKFGDRDAPMLAVFAPLFDENAKRTGTLLGRLQTTEMQRLLHAVPLERGTELGLVARGTEIDTALPKGTKSLRATSGVIGVRIDQPEGPNNIGLAIVARADPSVIYAPVRALAWQAALYGFAIFMTAGLAAWYLSRRIAAPVRSVASAARAIAAGDLNSQVDTALMRSTELLELGTSFNTMSSRMRSLIDGIEVTSLSIKTSVSDSLHTVRAVDSAAEKQERVVAQIALLLSRLADDAHRNSEECGGLERQSRMGVNQLGNLVRELDKTTDALSNLTAVIEQSNAAGRMLTLQANEVAVRAHQAGLKAEEVSVLAGEGGGAVQVLITDIQDVGSRLLSTTERLQELAKSTGEAIHSQLDVVNDMGERSKLLALNAAIEAARAGDAGRGFGVIATELHNLATHSQNASGSVASLVTRVLRETQTVAEEARAANLVATAAIERAQSAGDTFTQLIEGITDCFHAVRDIGNIAEKQARRTREIEVATQSLDEMAVTTTKALRNVGDLSKEVRKGIDVASGVAQSVSRATQDQLATVKIIGSNVAEIESAVRMVAGVATSSLQSTQRLDDQINTLTAQLEGFARRGTGEPPAGPAQPSRFPRVRGLIMLRNDRSSREETVA